jgi:hypothetical protein
MPNAVMSRLEQALATAIWQDANPGRTSPAPPTTGMPIPGFPMADPPPTRGLPTTGPMTRGVPTGGYPTRGLPPGAPAPTAGGGGPAESDYQQFPDPAFEDPEFPAGTMPTTAMPTTNLPRAGGRGGSSDPADRGRRIARSQPAPTSAMTIPLQTGQRPASRLNRMSTSTSRARRQAIEEQKADQPSRLRPVLMTAAATVVVLAVLGVGALGWHVLRGDSSTQNIASSSSGSAANAPAAAPLLAPVQSTNTNYSKKDLQAQVRALVTTSNKQPATPAASATAGSASAASAKAVQPQAVGPQDAASQDQELLRSPAALKSCLAAIGAQNEQPVAVDLARYAGQEAAIIVLPADSGGYEVEVVARDCRQGADGTIAVVNVGS